jgi:hypothetical protein
MLMLKAVRVVFVDNIVDNIVSSFIPSTVGTWLRHHQ